MMTKIVIIDSGVSIDHLPGYVSNLDGIEIKPQHENFKVIDDFQDHIGHGTIVFNVLSQYLKKTIEVYVIKIFDSIKLDNVSTLTQALKYCYNHIDCQIIQISAGLLYSNPELHDIIVDLTQKGVCIISAFDNELGISYPAAYEEVIGVDINHNYKKIEFYDIIENNVIDIRGANVFHRTKGINNKSIIVHGSSFYCSYIVAEIINNDLYSTNKRDIINGLKQKARKIYPSESRMECSKNLCVNKAIVFPFNKEIHSIAAFEDLLKFEIIDYYDIRQKGLINRNISEVIPYANNNRTIRNFDDIDWESNFDTFICGHTRELSKLIGKDILNCIVEQCILHNKKLICFDDVSPYLKKDSKLQVWFPSTSSLNIPRERFGKLRSPSIPTIGVFGTSSCQGKMTVQLLIRKALLKEKIKVCNIGSEPESELFGFEASYVFGYDSCDLFSPNEMIMCLNEVVYQLEMQKYDIIIAGSQSGTIPQQLRNTCMIPLKQYYFLLGIQPDSIILCVNSFDDIDYIKRTITFFESTVKASVICLVVSDINSRKYHLESHDIKYFEKNFSIPIMQLEKIDEQKLVDLIKTYYEVQP